MNTSFSKHSIEIKHFLQFIISSLLKYKDIFNCCMKRKKFDISALRHFYITGESKTTFLIFQSKTTFVQYEAGSVEERPGQVLALGLITPRPNCVLLR